MVYKNFGFCLCCNQTTQFLAKSDWLRDDYICVKCESIPRERALMYCIEQFFPDWQNLIIHETSPSNRGASRRLRMEAVTYIPSQYYPDKMLGQEFNGFRNENIEKMTFENNSIDLHISQDVLEHVFDPKSAFKEIGRTLKPGGAHIFTTPLVNKNKPTQICATKDNQGNIHQLVYPKEFHGNPISNEGSLVTMHWGYDITSYIYNSCGMFTEIVYIDSVELGIRAEYIEVLITKKPYE